MDDLNNPYRAPDSENEDDPELLSADEGIDPRRIGKAKSVPTVAILMMVHGVCMFLVACIMIGMIFIMVPQIAQQIENQQQIQRQQNPNAPQFGAQNMQTLLTATYGGIAGVLVVIGIIDIVAGIQNYRYRQRTFGIIALVLNIGSILFCWCLPLSIGLLIFGMIVYLSPEADRAFQWRSQNPEVP